MHNVLGLYEACGKRKREHYVGAFEEILLCDFCVQISFFDFSKSAINQIDEICLVLDRKILFRCVQIFVEVSVGRTKNWSVYSLLQGLSIRRLNFS